MEKAKNDEKIKRDNRPDYYSQGCAFSVIGLIFLILTLVTSYETLSVLPMPWVFYLGSMIIPMALFGFNILLASAWHNLGISLKYLGIAAALTICVSPLFYEFFGALGVIGSWFLAIPYLMAFQKIPVVIFPLLMIATCCVGIFCATKSITIPRNLMKKIAYLILLFAIAYIWGHAIRFEGRRYDEGLAVEGTTYHSIIYYGWLGDPGLVYLYECRVGYFGCELIYETPDYDEYDASETRLVYDEAKAVLRLEYHTSESNAQYLDAPPILYEHPIR